MHIVTTKHPTLTDAAGNPAIDVETCTRIEDAKAIYFGSLQEYGINNVTIVVDSSSFKDNDLLGYLEALNFEATWLETNPVEGTYVPKLAEDIDHWNKAGIFTPNDLAAYLDAEVEKERRKSY